MNVIGLDQAVLDLGSAFRLRHDRLQAAMASTPRGPADQHAGCAQRPSSSCSPAFFRVTEARPVSPRKWFRASALGQIVGRLSLERMVTAARWRVDALANSRRHPPGVRQIGEESHGGSFHGPAQSGRIRNGASAAVAAAQEDQSIGALDNRSTVVVAAGCLHYGTCLVAVGEAVVASCGATSPQAFLAFGVCPLGSSAIIRFHASFLLHPSCVHERTSKMTIRRPSSWQRASGEPERTG